MPPLNYFQVVSFLIRTKSWRRTKFDDGQNTFSIN